MKLTGNRCQCAGPPFAGCGEYFNSTAAFDRHRAGSYSPMQRRCLTPDEMRAAGMSRNEAGFWITAKFQSWLARDGDLPAIGSTPCPGSPPDAIAAPVCGVPARIEAAS